jgi:hypothetical protein
MWSCCFRLCTSSASSKFELKSSAHHAACALSDGHVPKNVVDGRIDDPDTGGKGRGLWTTAGTRTFYHNEGGKGSRPQAIKVQIRPDPPAR